MCRATSPSIESGEHGKALASHKRVSAISSPGLGQRNSHRVISRPALPNIEALATGLLRRDATEAAALDACGLESGDPCSFATGGATSAASYRSRRACASWQFGNDSLSLGAEPGQRPRHQAGRLLRDPVSEVPAAGGPPGRRASSSSRSRRQTLVERSNSPGRSHSRALQPAFTGLASRRPSAIVIMPSS